MNLKWLYNSRFMVKNHQISAILVFWMTNLVCITAILYYKVYNFYKNSVMNKYYQTSTINFVIMVIVQSIS